MLLRTSVADHIYYEYKGKDKGSDGNVTEETRMSKKRNKDKNIKNGKRIRKYGIDTTASSRKIMIGEILNNIMNENPEMCNNKYLFDDIKSLERDKKGKIQAREGLHDDAVMSYLIGLYMIYYGANVSKFIKRTYIGNNEEENSTKSGNKRVSRNINNLYKTVNGKTSSVVQDYKNKQREIAELERITGIKADSRNNNDNKKINNENKKKARSINALLRMSKM